MLKESDKAKNHDTPLEASLALYDALVLDAMWRQALVTVRSLGSRGLRVAALETSAGMPTFTSRWCREAFICTPEEGTEAYLAYLEQVLERTGARVLIPASDGTIALLRRYRERLEQRVCIALAKEPALGIAINKERTLEAAHQLGLSIPRGVTVAAVGEVETALREIGLPAVVKPVESWLWGEQLGTRVSPTLVTTLEEAQHAVEGLVHLGGTALIQQFLPGRREAVSLLYAQGQIYARFAQWAKRTLPPLGGTSVLRQSIALPLDIGNQAERLVREIELEGYSEVEFRRDSAGNPYLMEINPRLSASVEIAVRAGVDFPYLLYQWANGEKIAMVQSYRVGRWMRYLEGDLFSTVTTVRQHGRPGMAPPAKAILDFCVTFFIPMSYDYIDWRDPLPAWTATSNFVRFLFQRVGSSLSKRKLQKGSSGGTSHA